MNGSKIKNFLDKTIFFLFATLLFFVPIVLWPYTSEVFEFNKIVLTYFLTTLIFASWAIKSIIDKKITFRRTILDIPLIVFLISQAISTLLSIDIHTSIFGYYSRFNGGLLSSITYAFLYWTFVSNLDKKETIKLIKVWFLSAALVSFYGVLEHFGIDKNIWVQDVASRVFSTLGQPNWLAAWIVAFIPLTWVFAKKQKEDINIKISNKRGLRQFVVYLSFSTLLFVTLLFTKSRSGLLGFIATSGIFWGLTLFKDFKENIKPFLIFNGIYLIFALIIGTQWTPSIYSIISRSTSQTTLQTQGTALETGGTESGTIRKIVWQGALQIWLHYPIFGTGVETFAYSYYLFRPTTHNTTSEWNFIYNKAHNEFLNFTANTGTVGIVSYLILIGFSIYLMFVSKDEEKEDDQKNDFPNLNLALMAGFVSLSVSNFFGFSVVPTQLQFFFFPAIAFTVNRGNKDENEKDRSKNKVTNLDTSQKIQISAITIFTVYTTILIINYWNADISYSLGKSYNSVPKPDMAIENLLKAIRLSPSEAIYYGELADSYTTVAMAYGQTNNASSAANFTSQAIAAIQRAISLSPSNVNIRRVEFGIYVKLSTVDEKYLGLARDSLMETIKLAPTDAKLYYNLGVADANLGDYEKAVSSFEKSIELKPNYADARVQYAALLVHLKRNNEAKEQLTYILEKIDPLNSTARQALENIK